MTGAEAEVTYEVWREHRKGGPDACVGRGMAEASAHRLLREIGDDLANFCTFYVVRATTTRERVTPPAVTDPAGAADRSAQ